MVRVSQQIPFNPKQTTFTIYAAKLPKLFGLTKQKWNYFQFKIKNTTLLPQ